MKSRDPKSQHIPELMRAVWIHFVNVKRMKDGYRIRRKTKGWTACKLSWYILSSADTFLNSAEQATNFPSFPWHGEHFRQGQRRLRILPFSYLGPRVQLSELKANRLWSTVPRWWCGTGSSFSFFPRRMVTGPWTPTLSKGPDYTKGPLCETLMRFLNSFGDFSQQKESTVKCLGPLPTLC